MNDKYKGKYPAAWTDAQVDEYRETGREPAKASNGVWVEDITRDAKVIDHWTLAEMFALYNNELESTRTAGEDEFAAALLTKAQLQFADATKWGHEELYAWLSTGKPPAKTALGNFLNDPDRFVKDVHLLNDSELVDFGLGHFGPYERNREYVLIEALDRFGLPLGTTFEDYAEYCLNRTKPKLASHGSLVNDRTRAGRLVSEWTEDELYDWAIGDIDNAGQTDDALMQAVIAALKGEWFWSKAQAAKYINDGDIPDIKDIDVERLPLHTLPDFIRETKSKAAFAVYLRKIERRPMTPMEYSNDVVKFTGVEPAQWTNAEIFARLVEGDVPERWKTVWVKDQTRAERIPASLTATELEGAYRKTLDYSDEQRTEIIQFILESLRTHGKKPYNELYDDEALAFHYDGTEPQISEEGFFVHNLYRDSQPFELWNSEEIRALLKGNIQTTHEVPTPEKLLIGHLPESWEGLAPFEQQLQWFIDDVIPMVTENGVYVDDPRRCQSSITEWTNSELVALAHGWIAGLDNVSEESLIATLADRGIIRSSDWSLTEAVAFLTDGTLPEVTDFGTDKTKYDEKTITRKSDLKFYADWANGQIALPNSKEQIINRVRELIGATTASDSEILVFLKAYAGDNKIVFEEKTLLQQLQDGTEASRRKVVKLWNFPLEATTEEALFAYKVFKPGDLTSNGVLTSDPRRDAKGAYQWSLEELRAWARGEIGQGMSSTPATLATALRNLISSISPEWDDEAVKQFAATGAQPKRASTGALVVNVLRDKKYPSDWTDADLKAWAGRELVTPAKSVDVLLTLRTRFKVPTTYTDAQVLTVVLTGEKPNDIKEPEITNPLTATDAQLKAFFKGELSVLRRDEPAIFAEARARFKINVHWTDLDIVNFYSTGQYPKKTSTGVFVVDRLRDLLSVEKWSYAEMVALAKGEIVAPKIAIKGVAFIARARIMLKVDQNLPSDKWSINEITTFLQTGVRPSSVAGNVFVNDPGREGKVALSWSNDELKAWLRKDIPASVKAPEEDLWQVAYQRFNIPNPWYHEDARSYVLTGVSVPATPSGIWIRSRERDNRSVWVWSRAEVKAWARGQILPGLNGTEQELVTHAARSFNLPTTLSESMIKSKIAAIIEDTTPMSVSFVREDLLAFAAGMKKEGGIEGQAALYQTLLYRCITRVTALTGQDFVDGWTELLQFYFNHKTDLFKPGDLYNGVPLMSISSNKQKHFQYMTTLLFNTCDPATRDEAVKRTDWTLALVGLNSDDSRHNLLAYYGV